MELVLPAVRGEIPSREIATEPNRVNGRGRKGRFGLDGIELADLFGMPIPYVYSEVKRRITEALLADDRIMDVKNFELSHKGGDVSAKFEVVTKYGTIKTQKEVKFA